MKIYLDNNLGVANVEQEELTQDTIGYNILKVYIPNAVLTPYDTFTCYYGALLQNGRKVGWFAMEARTSSDADYEANYTLYKATLEQCIVSVEGKVYIGCQVLLGNSGNATLIKKNTAVVQFNVRKSVAINNDILVLDTDQTTTDVLESYKNLLENALLTYATKDTYTKTEVDTALNNKADKSTAITHSGNQLQDYSGNNIYPNVANIIETDLKETKNIDLTNGTTLIQGAQSALGNFNQSSTRLTLKAGYYEKDTIISIIDYDYDINIGVYSQNDISSAYNIFILNQYVKVFKTTVSGYLMITIRKSDNSDITADSNFKTNEIIKIEDKGFNLSKNYIDRNCKVRNKYFHFSLDDFYTALNDITVNEATYTSIYDNSTFALLKDLHDTYGCVISCYCYLDNGSYSIENVTTKFKKDFIEAKDWLKFGFHALNNSTNLENETYANAQTYYNRFVSAIINITGSWECIDILPRLHNFAGSEDAMKGLRDCKCGIVGALGADDNRQSYYLTSDNYNYLFAHEKLYDATNYLLFVTTDIRLERDDITPFYTMATNSAWGSKSRELIVFTHEWKLTEQINNIKFAIDWAYNNGYDFDFPMNRF